MGCDYTCKLDIHDLELMFMPFPLGPELPLCVFMILEVASHRMLFGTVSPCFIKCTS